MSELIHEVNSSLNEAQIREKQAFDEQNGPLQLVQRSVRTHSKVLISLRNNHKLLARVKAFDRHLNMVLENVKEMWTEYPSTKGKKPVDKDKFISKMFLRGDNVVVVLSTLSFSESH